MTSDKYIINASQSSGFNSDGVQTQALNVGDHYHYEERRVYEKLVSIHGSGITFDPNSFRDIILAIDSGISGIDDQPLDFATGIDINLKNELNNHSKSYFEQFVELDFYPEFYKLDKFFQLKENQQDLQRSVDNLIKALSRQILAFQGDEYFECVLLKICNKLIDSCHEQLKDKESEILLILYYFYCNCCIGKKLKDEKNVASK